MKTREKDSPQKTPSQPPPKGEEEEGIQDNAGCVYNSLPKEEEKHRSSGAKTIIAPKPTCASVWTLFPP
jgi:hypothetical protein